LRPVEPDICLSRRFRLAGKKVFTYIGTHAYYHGLDVVVRAAELLKRREDIIFLLIGNGPERQRLVALVKDRNLGNVIFEECSYEEMPICYSVTCAAIATLRDIPVASGMRLSKIFPPLSCGVPVVYSGSGEAAEMLREHRCGLVTAPEDAQALAEAVVQLADDPTTRDAFGKQGRALVEREFAWPVIVERWLSDLGRISENPARQTVS
jgi:colanic acid biosynthesis glycosyl transferase WcaI